MKFMNEYFFFSIVSRIKTLRMVEEDGPYVRETEVSVYTYTKDEY